MVCLVVGNGKWLMIVVTTTIMVAKSSALVVANRSLVVCLVVAIPSMSNCGWLGSGQW